MKMKRLSVLRAILGVGLLIGLSGPALASLATFDSASCTGTGGFFSELTTPNTGLGGVGGGTTGPFGAICVTLSGTSVTIDAETYAGFTMFGKGMLALNFSDTFTLGTITCSGTGLCSSGGAGTQNGFGSLNFSVNEFDGPTDGSTLAEITGTGTFSSADTVLVANANGVDATMHIFVDGCTATVCTGFAAEGPGTIRETPEPGVLSLLAIGMVGLGFAGMRRRRG
jgi:hypothetical protein